MTQPSDDAEREAAAVAAAADALSGPGAAERYGFRELPDGVAWPPADPVVLPVTRPGQVRDHYDAIVVGAGAGGGVAAHVLARAGLTVLVLERGLVQTAAQLGREHTVSARVFSGRPRPVDRAVGSTTRRVGGQDVLPWTPEWGGNAFVAGGGTRVYGAMAWRFSPEDFTMGATYGAPFTDWPISYADLEPYYDRVEWELGVAGADGPAPYDGPRSRGYPMPPMELNSVGARLAAGGAAAGLPVTAPPLLINTTGYNGRPACLHCGLCIGHPCPIEAKNGTHNTVLAWATASGRCDLVQDAVVTGLVTAGRAVTGVRVSAAGRVREVRARHVVLAAGAIETARLLLASGVGNENDQVGRYLQAHLYSGATGLFDEPVEDWRGPGPCVATTVFRHGNPGLAGGGILANDFVATPFEAWAKLRRAGFIAPEAEPSLAGLAEVYPRSAVVIGPVQEVPQAESRVVLAGGAPDAWGVPLVELSSPGLHDNDRRSAGLLADQAGRWLAASGARRVARTSWRLAAGPSAGQHQAGTCRMGTDPATSVTDARGRVWNWSGVSVADAALHVTNGGVNPALTILAGAWRVADLIAADP
ncbi:MAG: GMC oxidoreductase [Streptosporangiaceae bacterium]